MSIAVIYVDVANRDIEIDGDFLDPPLTREQWLLFHCLWRQRPRIVDRDSIVVEVWPDAFGGVTEQAIDGLVRRVRIRLTEMTDAVVIRTARARGFWIVCADARPPGGQNVGQGSEVRARR